MRAAGLRVEEHGYRLAGLRGDFRNVLGWREGTDRDAPALLIGAHYDTVPGTPGADDNASGVAALLALGRTLPARPRRTVALAAFSTEEASFLGAEGKGSLHCARWLLARGVRIEVMLSLEMLGYYADDRRTQRFPAPGMRAIYGDRGDFLAVVGDLAMAGTARRVARALGRAAGGRPPIRWFCGPAGMPGVLFSDHASFRIAGLRAVMLTDTAWLRNPHYHRASDRAETLDEERMAAAAAALRALV